MGVTDEQNENANIEFMKYPHYRTPNEIHDIGLRMAEIAVYAVLCRYCNPGTTAWPSYSSIAAKAGCSKPTAIKAVERLIKLGLLKKTKRRIGADKMNSNLYEVNHDIRGQYLKLAPDNQDTSPENLNSGKARLLPLVKEIYRGGKGGCPDKELPIKNYEYKELSTGNFSSQNPTVNYSTFKKQYAVNEVTDEAITYYLKMFKQEMGSEHMNLQPETWQDIADSLLLVIDGRYKEDYIEISSFLPMVKHYFNKDYNNGKCNRCITHFNDPGIKEVNFYEAGYYDVDDL